MEISVQKSNQIKVIAILMMLFLHLFNRPYQGLFEPILFIGKQPLSYYISLFCDACVPIFCFVSGYGLYFKFKKDPVTYNKGNIMRIKNLYINYWIIVLLFAVLLGWWLNKDGFPGSWTKFLLNFVALDNSYNAAWWFFFIYILLVVSSPILFRWTNKIPILVIVSLCLLFYLAAFYFRVYRPNLFNTELLNWLQRQICLFGTSLLPFVMGAIALKEEWNTKITQAFKSVRYKSALAISVMIVLIIVHGIVPNFIIAPFLAIPFIFLFAQIKVPVIVANALNHLAPHATNIWLIHMFFYMIYFQKWIYSPKYVLLIFLLLVTCSLVSSIIVNKIYKFILKLQTNYNHSNE